MSPPIAALRIRGLSLGLGLPALLFALLQIPPYSPDYTAVAPPPTGTPGCPPARIVLPPSCRALPLSRGETVPMHNCDPGSDEDERWRALVRFEGLGPRARCDYAPRVIDSRRLERALLPTSAPRADSFPRWSCRRTGDAWELDIELAPWRASAVVLTLAHPDGSGDRVFASPPVRLRAVRASGVSVRSSARFAFFFECLAAALAMVLMYRHRPRAPAVPSPSAPPRGHWVRVAVASAAGGAIMGALSAIRPADFGGFDIPQPARLFAQIPLGAAVAAFIGCWLDLCRRSFEASSRGGRAAALVLASVVIALIAPRIYLATSAWALPGLPAGYGYKTRYYTYFAVAGLMPLVTVRVAPRSGQDPQRRLRLPAGQHALLLFALSFGAAALANGVAIAGARLLQPAIMPAGESGFFKPMSAWGLLLVSAPALLGVSLGLSHGDERPLWLQRLHATLVDALEQPDPVRRAASCRSLIAALCQRHLADPASLRTPAAAPLGHHIGWLLQGFADSEADLDQLAARLGRSPAQVRASLPELVAALEDAVAAAPEPLRATLEVGLPELTRLRVTLVHEPPGPTSIHAPLVLVVDGRLTDPQAVASVTAHLEEVLSALTATERRLLAGARILAELRVAPGASWASTLQVMPLALGCGVWAALSPPDTSGREARCAEAIAHAMPGAGTGEAGLAAAAFFDALRQGDR